MTSLYFPYTERNLIKERGKILLMEITFGILLGNEKKTAAYRTAMQLKGRPG